jgi:homoaconitase/3-isopropylmalate dehydratase large subunit
MVPSPDSAEWASAVAHWRSLTSDPGAHYDRTVIIDASSIAPTVTWGTSPEQTAPITGKVPTLSSVADPAKRAQMERALKYMGLTEAQGKPLTEIPIDKVRTAGKILCTL